MIVLYVNPLRTVAPVLLMALRHAVSLPINRGFHNIRPPFKDKAAYMTASVVCEGAGGSSES